MRDHRPQAHIDLFNKLSVDITGKANFLGKLNQQVKDILPHAEKTCRVANFRDGILVLECSSSAWATRLNYERQHLLSSLRKTMLPSLMTIEIKINPALAQAEIDSYRKKAEIPAPISPSAADSLLTVASITSEKIAKKLIDIAKLSEKKA